MRTLRSRERFCRTCPQLNGSGESSLMIRLAMSRVLEVYKPHVLESLLAETILCKRYRLTRIIHESCKDVTVSRPRESNVDNFISHKVNTLSRRIRHHSGMQAKPRRLTRRTTAIIAVAIVAIVIASGGGTYYYINYVAPHSGCTPPSGRDAIKVGFTISLTGT